MAINKVEYAGNTLIDLTQDSVTEEQVHYGVKFHGADGNTKTGTFTIDQEITEQDSLISQIKTALQGKAAGGGGSIGDSDLPAGYRRVNYIQFSNAQIVDTGIVCNQDTKIRVLFTRESDDSVYMYGVASSGNTASFTAYLSTNGSWRFGNKYVSRPISMDMELIRNAIVTKTGVKHETGTATMSGVSDFETVGTLLLGACRDADGTLPASGNTKYTGKIFILEMWIGDEQIRKLIPVTDGTVYRFYDAISKEFFDSITDAPLEGGNI